MMILATFVMFLSFAFIYNIMNKYFYEKDLVYCECCPELRDILTLIMKLQLC